MSIGKFTISGGGINVVKSQLFAVPQNETDQPDRTSYFGTPVFSNIEIAPFQYDTLSGETIQIQNGIIIDTVLITVTQSKNIVKTPIQGRNGTVKEYISDGDFQIDISGSIVSQNPEQYPETDVNEFIQILKSPVAIEIVSEYLNWFDIQSVVVESYNFPQIEGVRNVQQFNVTAISDTPVELQDLDF